MQQQEIDKGAPEGQPVMKDNNKNTITKYVRVRRVIRNSFVEFDFAINDPELFVELILPLDAFEIFCRDNDVVELTEEQGALIDQQMEKWRYGEETLAADNKNRTYCHGG